MVCTCQKQWPWIQLYLTIFITSLSTDIGGGKPRILDMHPNNSIKFTSGGGTLCYGGSPDTELVS